MVIFLKSIKEQLGIKELERIINFKITKDNNLV